LNFLTKGDQEQTWILQKLSKSFRQHSRSSHSDYYLLLGDDDDYDDDDDDDDDGYCRGTVGSKTGTVAPRKNHEDVDDDDDDDADDDDDDDDDDDAQAGLQAGKCRAPVVPEHVNENHTLAS